MKPIFKIKSSNQHAVTVNIHLVSLVKMVNRYFQTMLAIHILVNPITNFLLLNKKKAPEV